MHVSHSRFKVWRRCHKQHDYKYNQRLQRKRRGVPMLRGTIFGEMLDARAIALNGGKMKPMDVLEKYRRKYRVLFAEEREKYGDVVGDIKRIYEGYERKYADDPWEYLKTEHLLTIDLAKDIRYIGYIDKVVRDQQKQRWLADHKAYRSIPNDDDRFSDLQNVFYIWAWGEQHPNDPVLGFVWDYIRTKAPAIPELLKKGELTRRANIDTDYHTYMDAIRVNDLNPKDYKEILEGLKKENSRFFKRVYLPSPSREMIDNAVKDAKDTAIEIKNLGQILKDRNMTRDCPRQCDYYNLCQSEYRGIDSDFIRKTEFEIRDPHEEKHEEES
jgi:hypothetical protein